MRYNALPVIVPTITDESKTAAMQDLPEGLSSILWYFSHPIKNPCRFLAFSHKTFRIGGQCKKSEYSIGYKLSDYFQSIRIVQEIDRLPSD